jgi:outer membrane protein assembly factor BamB
MRPLLGLALLPTLALATACGGASHDLGAAFSTDWQNDNGRSIAQVQQRLATAKLPPGAAVAVGVTDKGLVGIGLDGSGRWEHAVKLDTRPAVAGQVVVGTGGGQVFALDAKSGRQLWSFSDEGHSLVGAGDDGKTTVVNLGGMNSPGSLVLAVDHRGHVVRRLQPKPLIGKPAVLGGVAFLPWGDQYVSAIDLSSGQEAGRLLMRDQVSHALAIGGQLYFGQRNLVRFDSRIDKAAVHQADRVDLPDTKLPGSPEWFHSGTAVEKRRADARDSIQLFARPTGTRGKPKLAADRLAATYFRVVLGLDGNDGSLRWVRALPENTLGGAAAASGFAICDSKGDVWRIGADGSDAGKVSLGAPLESCVVQGGDYQVSGGKAPGPLAEQIASAVELPNAELVTIQRYLLDQLGPLENPIVTKVLIGLAENPRTAPMLLKDANELLAKRRNGEKYMLEALKRHYDYLSDVLRPPPVAPLADALAAMGIKEAAPLLAEHLNDPADSPADIEHAARALEKLATPDEYESLKTFFSLYRATADEQPLVDAVVATGKTLVRVGGDNGRKVVEQAVSDPLTMPDVKAGLADAVKPAPKRKG